MATETYTPQQLLEKYGMPEKREGEYFQRGQVSLLAPADYKMSIMIGSPDRQVGVITGWGDPWHVVTDEVAQQSAVIASLRTPFGVELMLSNLARNPQIGHLVTFAAEKNDNTATGQLPRKLALDLWQHGVSEEGVVVNNGYQLSPELVENGALEVVRKIITGVDWQDKSDLTASQLADYLGQISPKAPYMDPVKSPPFKIRQIETWPSERVGHLVREKDGFDAWLGLLAKINRYGQDGLLETNAGTKVRELPFVRVAIEGGKPFANVPEWARNISALEINPESLEDYYKRFFRPESYMKQIFPGVEKFIRPADEKYLYAELLWAYPRSQDFTNLVTTIAESSGTQDVVTYLERAGYKANKLLVKEVIGATLDSKPILDEIKKAQVLLELYCPPFNQVAEVIKRLRQIPDDADKVVNLWDPYTHGTQYRGRPCLMEIDLLARKGVLDTHAVFRTHDIAKGWIFNAYGVWRLMEDIAQEGEFIPGTLVLDSSSAHIYGQDSNWVGDLVKEQFGKKPITRKFDEKKADPRGNVRVNLVDGQVQLQLVEPGTGRAFKDIKIDGDEIRSPRDLARYLDQKNILSQAGHGLYMGHEIAYAEIAGIMGIDFTQDQSFRVRQELEKRMGKIIQQEEE